MFNIQYSIPDQPEPVLPTAPLAPGHAHYGQMTVPGPLSAAAPRPLRPSPLDQHSIPVAQASSRVQTPTGNDHSFEKDDMAYKTAPC